MNWQRLVEWFILAISVFNTISLFWLGILVWLRGDKRLAGTWLTSLGMAVGGILFTSHTAIFGQGIGNTSFGMNFWWWVSWLPAVIAPAAWFSCIYWYARTFFSPGKWVNTGSGLIVILSVVIFWSLVFINPIPRYDYVAGNEILPTPNIGGMPVLIAAYLLYVLLCFLLPLGMLWSSQDRRIIHREDPRIKARSWLAMASLSFLVFAGILVSAAIWAVFSEPLPTLRNPADKFTVILFDLASCISVATGITVLGRAIVAYEVFTGRALPRVGFFQHWRSTVLAASGIGVLVAALIIYDVRPLYSLIVITLLMTGMYALFSWRVFTERDTFMQKLKPYVESLNLYPQLLDTEPPNFQQIDLFFSSLCNDILGVGWAVLEPAGSFTAISGSRLTYGHHEDLQKPDFNEVVFNAFSELGSSVGENHSLTTGTDVHMIPLRKESGLVGIIICGPKTNRSPFTQDEIEIAQMGGERILDMMAALTLSEMVIDLLRDRLAQAHIIEGQGRHLLHDEILPELHSAIITLSSLRSVEMQPVIGSLTSAHRKISDLLHDVLPPPPIYLSQQGLHYMVKEITLVEYREVFACVDWHWEEKVDHELRQLPEYVVEIIFYGLRELIRNAATHARSDNGSIQMWIKAEIDNGLVFQVVDNGAGFRMDIPSEIESAKVGLKLHSAMLAVIGAVLEINTRVGGGVSCRITFPATAVNRWKSARVGRNL